MGKDVDQARMTALYLERTAKMQAFSHLLGFQRPTYEFIESIIATWESKGDGRNRRDASWRFVDLYLTQRGTGAEGERPRDFNGQFVVRRER